MAAESKLEKFLKQYAEKKQVKYYKFTSPGRRGVADRLLVGTAGRVYFLELKAPKKFPSRQQSAFIRTMRGRGVPASGENDQERCKKIIDSLVARNTAHRSRHPQFESLMDAEEALDLALDSGPLCRVARYGARTYYVADDTHEASRWLDFHQNWYRESDSAIYTANEFAKWVEENEV